MALINCFKRKTQLSENQTKMKTIKTFVAALLIICLATALAFSIKNIVPSILGYNSAGMFHNNKTSANISLGMSKSAIDRKLGKPDFSKSFYVYLDSGLTISYKNKHATFISVATSDWEYADIGSVSLPVRNLVSLYGNDIREDGLVLMYDSHSDQTPYRGHAKYIAVINSDHGYVSSIAITYASGYN